MLDLRFFAEWDRFDKGMILEALIRSHAEHVRLDNPIAKFSDPYVAYRRLISGEQPAVLVDGYLLVYHVTELWSGLDRIVIEEYVVAVSKRPGPLRSVTRALEAIAEATQCKGIFTGNATSDERLSRFYARQGYRPAGSQFYKESTWARQ